MGASASSEAERAAAPRLDRRLLGVWAGVLLAPAAWILDFMTRYLLIRYSNVRGVHWPQHLATAICLLPLLVGVWLCWRGRRAGAEPDDLTTLATWGLALAAFFLLLMLAQAYPAFVLDVREIT